MSRERLRKRGRPVRASRCTGRISTSIEQFVRQRYLYLRRYPRRIAPEASRTSGNAPSPGRAEVGAARSKRSADQRDYLSVKLDDPSFNAPIYANLVQDEEGEGFALIWSRSRKANAD